MRTHRNKENVVLPDPGGPIWKVPRERYSLPEVCTWNAWNALAVLSGTGNTRLGVTTHVLDDNDRVSGHDDEEKKDDDDGGLQELGNKVE